MQILTNNNDYNYMYITDPIEQQDDGAVFYYHGTYYGVCIPIHNTVLMLLLNFNQFLYVIKH